MKNDIEKHLNDGFEQMTPDVLDQVLNSPKNMIESEEELFGLLEPETVVRPHNRRLFYSFASAAVAAILALSLIVIRPAVINQQNVQAAGSICLNGECNITITYDKDGKVIDITGKTASDKKVAKQLEKEMGKDPAVYDTIDKVIDYYENDDTSKKETTVQVSRKPSKKNASEKVEKKLSKYLEEKNTTSKDKSNSASSTSSNSTETATECTTATETTEQESTQATTETKVKKTKSKKKSKKHKKHKKQKKSTSQDSSTVDTTSVDTKTTDSPSIMEETSTETETETETVNETEE